MKNSKFVVSIILGGCFLFAALLMSCNENSPVASQSQPSASVSMMSDPGASPSNNNITITSAKFLIEFIKLEKSHGSDDADLKEGPFVADVSLTNRATLVALKNIAPGTYTEVHFKIHKHTPNEVVIDPDFGTTGVGYSGIITGTYNGAAFVYRTAITASQEVDIDPPIVIPAVQPTPVSVSTVMNVTLLVSPGMWFVNNGVILNPLDAANQTEIDENIRNSFRSAFEDEDHDGHHDHGH